MMRNGHIQIINELSTEKENSVLVHILYNAGRISFVSGGEGGDPAIVVLNIVC